MAVVGSKADSRKFPPFTLSKSKVGENNVTFGSAIFSVNFFRIINNFRMSVRLIFAYFINFAMVPFVGTFSRRVMVSPCHRQSVHKYIISAFFHRATFPFAPFRFPTFQFVISTLKKIIGPFSTDSGFSTISKVISSYSFLY